MKKKIVYVLIIFVAFLFLLPNKIRAVSCTSLTPPGRCDVAVTCSQGTPLNGSCGPLQVCCPVITTPCTSLTPPGKCDVAASCSVGTPLNGSCGPLQVCCPIITASCASLGGRCDVAATCSQGTPMNGSCGPLQVCCPIITPGGSTSDILCTPAGGTTDSGIKTAIGCIPVLNNDNGTSLMAFILRWAVGVGGGIAFLLILYGGFMVMTSAGNPERLKAGQELLTSAISGLILLIFSVFILKFIGIDILGLNAFGFGK